MVATPAEQAIPLKVNGTRVPIAKTAKACNTIEKIRLRIEVSDLNGSAYPAWNKF